MTPQELGVAAEERGFDSVWSPEHSHIPLSRKSAFPSGGELPKKYYDAMDPFVALMAAAAVTKTIKVGTGVCLVAQRDPIQTAKNGGLDRPAVERPLPVRHRQRLEQGRDAQPRHRVRDPPQAGARADRGDEGDLDQVQARVSRRDGQLRPDDDLAQAGAEAAPADPGRRRLPLRRAPRHPLRRRLDAAPRAAALPQRARLPARVPQDGGRRPTATCRSRSGAPRTRTC